MEIYTDGACKGNGTANSRGGWAYVVVPEKDAPTFYVSGREENTTNQRMELMAAIRGCEEAERLCDSHNMEDIYIVSDSAYLINCYTQSWWRAWMMKDWRNSKNEPVANRDLWEKLIPYFKDARFNFKKVKGHSDDHYNIMVDKLAQNAAMGVQN